MSHLLNHPEAHDVLEEAEAVVVAAFICKIARLRFRSADSFFILNAHE